MKRASKVQKEKPVENNPCIGVNACKQYLLLIEEISYQCEELGEIRKKELVAAQQMMFEVFKRVVNNENLDNIKQDLGHKTGAIVSDYMDVKLTEFIKNYQIPSIRA